MTYNQKNYHGGPSLVWQIVRELEDAILRYELTEGDFIYPIKKIMMRFDTSDKTAHRVVDILQTREILTKIPGKGLLLNHGTREAIKWHRKQDLKQEFKRLFKEADLLEIPDDEFEEMIS
ncbi:MAG: GntR family transcriptional regulator [Firmicutes bacterium]|nr:GntR family transcriptional regulator [Bacillota bacterium]